MAKIVLFDGTGLDMWRRTDGTPAEWELGGDGSMTVVARKGDIMSTVTFRDAHIHVEWMEPDMPDRTGPYKGNSGVYIHGCYEVQILDSSGVTDLTSEDCGGIYEMYAPRANACKPPLTWQELDIYFRAPRYDEKGEMTECARATILQNGVCVQNNIQLYHHTPGGVTEYAVAEGPLMLQDHRDPVKFRNVWIEEL